MGSAWFTVYVPRMCGEMLDVVIKKDVEYEKISYIAWKFGIIIVIGSICIFVNLLINGIIYEKIHIKLRNEFFKCMMKHDIEFFEFKKTGDILNRLSDIKTVAHGYGYFAILMRWILIFIGKLAILVTINQELAKIILIYLPIYLSILSSFSRSLKKLTKKQHNHISQSTIIAEECFSNMKTVKAFAAEKREYQNYKQKTNKAYESGIYSQLIGALHDLIVNLLTYGSVLIILLKGYQLISNNLISPGELSSFMLYTLHLAGTSGKISSAFNRVASSSGIAESIFIYMDYNSNIKLSKNPYKPEDIKGNIEFRKVDFSYPSKQDIKILKQFNLTIKPGEVIAVVGSSGGGKSTIINLIERFYDSYFGEILIDGHNIKDYDLKYIRNKIGYVAQEPVLFSGSIEENIVYGVESYTLEELNEVTRLVNAYAFIHDQNLFPDGYKSMVGEKGCKLSGGQKQRIAIARALLKKPKILIFDEATSALDAESEFQVQQAMETLMKKGNMTVIVIAHRLSTIINSERIIVLANGYVAEQGTHKQLLSKKGIYRQLVERQIQGLI